MGDNNNNNNNNSNNNTYGCSGWFCRRKKKTLKNHRMIRHNFSSAKAHLREKLVKLKEKLLKREKNVLKNMHPFSHGANLYVNPELQKLRKEIEELEQKMSLYGGSRGTRRSNK